MSWPLPFSQVLHHCHWRLHNPHHVTCQICNQPLQWEQILWNLCQASFSMLQVPSILHCCTWSFNDTEDFVQVHHFSSNVKNSKTYFDKLTSFKITSQCSLSIEYLFGWRKSSALPWELKVCFALEPVITRMNYSDFSVQHMILDAPWQQYISLLWYNALCGTSHSSTCCSTMLWLRRSIATTARWLNCCSNQWSHWPLTAWRWVNSCKFTPGSNQ